MNTYLLQSQYLNSFPLYPLIDVGARRKTPEDAVP